MNDITINSLGFAVGTHDEHQAKWVLQTGRLDHDWFTLEILQSFIPHGNILDIGANIGTHTIFYERVAGFYGCHVYAFEANPVSFKCLAHNCKRAIKYPIALGDSASLLTLHPSGNLGSVYVSHDPSYDAKSQIQNSSNTVVVPSQRLDSFFFDNVGYIKIDVEGFEEYVLAGAQHTIMKNRPMIWIEMSPGHLSRAGSGIENVLKQFENMRYFPEFYKGSSVQCDVMMVPSEMRESCMHTVLRTAHIVPLASQDGFDLSLAFMKLREFFGKEIC